MSNIFLKNLFSPVVPSQISATVKKRLEGGKYEVEDDSGNVFPVYTSSIWSPSERVIVQNGRIVSKAGSISGINVYQV